MRIDALGLQLGKVVGGWWHKGCFIVGEVGWQGKLDKSVDYQVIQGRTGRSWTMKKLLVVREAAQELRVHTMQPL